jgi:hypothetical protein
VIGICMRCASGWSWMPTMLSVQVSGRISDHEPVSKTLAKQNQDTRQLHKAQKIDTRALLAYHQPAIVL